jgi:hypothetical protein
MIDHGMGVSTKVSHKIKRVDTHYSTLPYTVCAQHPVCQLGCLPKRL